MSTRTTKWDIPGSAGQPIFGNTHLPDGGAEAARGVLLLLHGFKGYKDYGFLPRLAQAVADHGLIAHRFNFSHSGMTHAYETFERPDLFEADTWSKQVADVVTVAAAIAAGALPGAGLPLVLYGHSRGGVTALLSAVELGGTVDGVVTAAAPHEAVRMDPDQRRMLRKAGRMLSPSGRTGQDLFVGLGWLEEIEAAPDRFDPVKAIAKLACPVLLLHGDADETVSYVSAHALHDAPGENSAMRILPGASHVFDSPNPLPDDAELPANTAAMIQAATEFAVRCCDTAGG